MLLHYSFAGRIPVLNTHPLALRVLRSKVFKSFVIFVKPPPFDILKVYNNRMRLFMILQNVTVANN